MGTGWGRWVRGGGLTWARVRGFCRRSPSLVTWHWAGSPAFAFGVDGGCRWCWSGSRSRPTPPGLARAWAFTRGFDDDDGGGKDGDGGERSDGGKTDVMWQRVNCHSSLPDLGITNYKLIIYLNIVNNTNNPFRTDSVPVIPVCIPGICRFR